MFLSGKSLPKGQRVRIDHDKRAIAEIENLHLQLSLELDFAYFLKCLNYTVGSK